MADQMLSNLIELVSTRAVKGAELRIQPIPGDVTEQLLVQNGGYTAIKIPRPIRRHKVLSLESLYTAVKKWGDKAAVFHSPGKIVAVLDDAQGIGTVEMDLIHTVQFLKLQSLEKTATHYEQAGIIRLLRTELAGVFVDSLIESLRRVGATTSGSTTGEVRHGLERGSREFAAQIAAECALPEEPQGQVEVYFNVKLEAFPIQTVLEPMLMASPMKFLLQPLPQETAKAIEVAHSLLHAELVKGLGKDVTVIFGAVGEKSLR